jgi:hypothetical protein
VLHLEGEAVLLRSAAAAVAAGVLATAPAASAAASTTADEAWPPGNCQQGTFCVWPNWAEPATGPTETPSIVTSTNWSGSAPGKQYYNYTSQNFDLTYAYTFPDGEVMVRTFCVPSGGNIFYIPVSVTSLTVHQGSC